MRVEATLVALELGGVLLLLASVRVFTSFSHPSSSVEELVLREAEEWVEDLDPLDEFPRELVK